MERLGCGHHRGGTDRFTLPGADHHYPPDLELEPRHLDITLRLDIPEHSAEATVVVRVEARRSGVRALVLQAVDFDAVEVADGAGRQLSWRYDGARIHVLWEQAFDRAEVRELRVSYRVHNPLSGLMFSTPDDTYPELTSWAATDHETERARYWLPCVDHPSVRTTVAFHITSDAAHTILANGILESETTTDSGTRTANWRLDFPCPSYLICFIAGDLVRADDRPVGDRPLAYFGARGRVTGDDLMRSFGKTPAMMEWMQAKLGRPFPFPKYYQFALPGFGGAMENISLVSWTDRLVLDETLATEWQHVTDSVNVHEMAHSYFGDAVVIRDFAHAWLKESWATYMEACWLEDQHGDDELRYELRRMKGAYAREVDERYARPIVTRVYDSSWSMFDLHLYPGGAWRLHMLRRELGDDLFWTAVSDYLATFDQQVVETSDFQRKLEQHSGRSLERFFEQWLHRPGFPTLEVELDFDDEERSATFRVKQGDGDGEPFRFPLTIAWESPDGAWERRDVEVDRMNQSFVIAMTAMPAQVRVDPDDALLHRLKFNPGDGQLRRALTTGPDAVARIHAADELARTGRARNLRAIAEAYESEPFWGAREGMAEAVAQARTGLTAELLARFLAIENDPRVLFTIATKAGQLRDPRIAAALTALLDRQPPYRVAAAALRSLGQQRGTDHIERLQRAADDDGYQAIVRSGALLGLAETRTEAAFEILVERVGYGRESLDAAPAAAEALGLCARFLAKGYRTRALERLADQATDPRERVRQFVVTGLESLGEEDGAAVVESMQQGEAEQFRPSLRRIARDLRNVDATKTPTARLTERFERLEEEHRKLAERLDGLESRRNSD